MIAVKAKVRNGRLTVDEPTDLPDGTVVELVQPDPFSYLDETDDMDPAEQQKLDEAIDRAWTEHQSGAKSYSADEVLARLRANA